MEFGRTRSLVLCGILFLTQGTAYDAHAQDERGPAGLRIYAVTRDGDLHNLWVINPANGRIDVITSEQGHDPWRLAVSRDGTRLYVAQWFAQTISVIDTADTRGLGAEQIGGLGHGYPVDFAVSPDRKSCYVLVNGALHQYPHDTINVFDTSQPGRLKRQVVLGDGLWCSPRRLGVSPDGRRLYVTLSRTGYLAVIDTTTGRQMDPVKLSDRPGSLMAVAVSPDGTRVYVARNSEGKVSVLDTTARPIRIVAEVSVGEGPSELVVSPDGSRVYVTNVDDETLSVIDTASYSSATVMLVMGKPWGLAVNPDGTRVYVARDVTGDSDTLSVLDTATNQVVTTIDTPRGLRWIAVKP